MERTKPKFSKISVRRSRFLALCILVFAVVLAGFDFPNHGARAMRAVGFPTVAGKTESVGKYFSYRFGLDVLGGTHLVYRADIAAVPAADREGSLDALKDVIERRVNLFGITEPLIQRERASGDERLIVELAGVTDIHQAIALIGATPFLEFREEVAGETPSSNSSGITSGLPVFVPTEFTGRHIQKADLAFDPTTGAPQVSLEMTSEGAGIFAELTKRNIGRPLAIYLDGVPISAPVVQTEIREGRAQITGSFTVPEVKELVGRLNAGALPVPITLIAQRSIGASLGKESLIQSLQAGLWGFALLGVFMAFWYRLPGVVSVFALLCYVAITLALFKIFSVTLTIAGVTGFILSLAVAVDANVLIFERTKEEILGGKSVSDALGEGFGRAWSAIKDSNVSGIVTAAILYWFGSGLIRGFALTLGIGIVVSLFSTIWITRTLLVALLTERFKKHPFLYLSGLSK